TIAEAGNGGSVAVIGRGFDGNEQIASEVAQERVATLPDGREGDGEAAAVPNEIAGHPRADIHHLAGDAGGADSASANIDRPPIGRVRPCHEEGAIVRGDLRRVVDVA